MVCASQAHEPPWLYLLHSTTVMVKKEWNFATVSVSHILAIYVGSFSTSYRRNNGVKAHKLIRIIRLKFGIGRSLTSNGRWVVAREEVVVGAF